MTSAVLGLLTPTQILSFAAADDFHQKQLGSDEASYAMEILQAELDHIRSQKDAQPRKYLKSIRHLNRIHGVLPPSMFLTGLTRESPTAVAGGGFADVWIGRLDKQRVCIKVLRFFQQGSDREELLKALSKEVLLWRQLNHPNILPFLGVNTKLFAPSFCIVSPWMSNGDIMVYTRKSSLDLGTKLQHTIQIAEGLLYLHSLDPPVVHGDIKGANILISDEHRCCLADFGLAVLDTQSMNPALTATVQGSLRWLAPEFINPTPMPTQGKLTSRDIYAFGCTVFEILTGQPPFSHLNLDISVAMDVLKGVRPVLSPVIIPKEDIFKLIRELLDSCWAEGITHRPDAQTMLDSMKQICNLLHNREEINVPDTNAVTTMDILTPVGVNYTSDEILPSSSETFYSFVMRAAPISDPPLEPQVRLPSTVKPTTNFPQRHRGPSLSILLNPRRHRGPSLSDLLNPLDREESSITHAKSIAESRSRLSPYPLPNVYSRREPSSDHGISSFQNELPSDSPSSSDTSPGFLPPEYSPLYSSQREGSYHTFCCDPSPLPYETPLGEANTRKLSNPVRRDKQCFSCHCTSTVLWRKSKLSAGEFLCNKCGLLERKRYTEQGLERGFVGTTVTLLKQKLSSQQSTRVSVPQIKPSVSSILALQRVDAAETIHGRPLDLIPTRTPSDYKRSDSSLLPSNMDRSGWLSWDNNPNLWQVWREYRERQTRI